MANTTNLHYKVFKYWNEWFAYTNHCELSSIIRFWFYLNTSKFDIKTKD